MRPIPLRPALAALALALPLHARESFAQAGRPVSLVPGALGGLFLSWWVLALALGAIAAAFWILVRRQARQAKQSRDSTELLLAQRGQELAKATEAMRMTKQVLENLNLTDTITGLHNRRYLSMVIGNDAASVLEVYRDARTPGPLPNQDLVFFLVGVDQLRQLLSRHGADAVNELLKRTAQVLRKASRETDLVLRWTDEEFLLIARNTSREEAPIVAERIRRLMGEQILRTPQVAIGWSCSVGFAPFPFLPSDPEWLGWERVLEVAEACYQTSRRMGANQWAGVLAQPGLNRGIHGKQIPGDLGSLVEVGVLQALSSHPDLFGRRVGEVLG